MADKEVRLIDANRIVEVAEHAYHEWNLAMVGADDTRKVNKVYKMQELCKVVKAIAEDCPTIEAEPVRHGWWEKSEDDYCGLNIYQCSLCHEEWCFEIDDDVKDLNYHYCPNCGAKMDLEE